jgi:hypothetical protein
VAGQDDDLRSKHEIHDVVLRVARGIDRCDVDLIRSCYHPDAHEEHGWFFGSAWEFAGRLVEQKLAETEQQSHMISNVLVELEGPDAAWVESYYVAVQRPLGGALVAAGGRYLDRFERRAGVWLIARRLVILDWSSAEAGGTRDSLFARGRRDRTDPSYDFS